MPNVPAASLPRRVRSRSRSTVLVAALVTGTMAAAACSGDDGETVRVYTGRHYDLEAAFTQFSEETGISVEFLTGSDAELRERIAAEGEDTEADVYMTVDAGNLATAVDQDVFAAIDSPLLDDAVPSNLRDPDGHWYGLSVRARTIVYHPDRIEPSEVPTTYEELADPAWDGRLCLRNSSNVYTQSLVAGLIAGRGLDGARPIVQGWADNAEMMSNDVLVLESIAAGQCDAGITNHYYLARLIEEDPDFPVELVWADQDGAGVHVNISGAGVTRYADDPELAQRLIEWLATDGQSAFVDGNHEYPVNPEVEPEPLIVERFGASFVQDQVNAAEFGRLAPDAIELLDETGYR